MCSTNKYLFHTPHKAPVRCVGGHILIPPWIGKSSNKIADSVSNLGRDATESAGVASISEEVEHLKYIREFRHRLERGGGHD